MVSFMLMEKSDVKIHLIHSLADDRIPFCQYFIIPYVLWYFFLIGTVIYFALSCPSKKEYYQYLGTLGIGMTLFLLISYIYPNGQNMRPDLTGDGIFISAIRFLYKIDTPTNIFPSMHVFNATASCVALFQNERCRRNRTFTVAQIVLTVSIVLSTMFLKQHSVADVMTALILNILCYQLFYRIIPASQAKLEKILTRKEIFTVPHLLSSLRLCLAIAFLGICQRYGFRENRSLLDNNRSHTGFLCRDHSTGIYRSHIRLSGSLGDCSDTSCPETHSATCCKLSRHHTLLIFCFTFAT